MTPTTRHMSDDSVQYNPSVHQSEKTTELGHIVATITNTQVHPHTDENTWCKEASHGIE